MLALGIEHAVQERGGGLHLLVRIEPFEVDHHRNPVLADAARDTHELGLGARGVHHDMAELVGQRNEVALRIDDALLHPRRALFEQPAKKMRLAGTGIALHEQARGEQLLQVHHGRRAVRALAHIDADFQCKSPIRAALLSSVRMDAGVLAAQSTTRCANKKARRGGPFQNRSGQA